MNEHRVIREVPHGSAEYWATVDLRDAVLRKPLGLALQTDELQRENDSYHVACFLGHALAACLVLKPQSDGDIRMRQVAVVPELQGRGIGAAMVEYSEILASNRGFLRMVLHARETAVPFYEKLGYTIVGERFLEVTIPHWSMEKRLHSP